MKILWIEDFGGPLSPSEVIEEMFCELFKDIDLSDEYHEEITDIPAQLSELFGRHTLHEIHVCKSYLHWKEVDAWHRGDFDIALIDINLGSYATPNDELPPGIDRPDFDKQAGFYIYHQLIKKGFSDDNVAFFTAEGQSLNSFTKYCGDILLERPAHCFQKNPTQFKQLRQWLAQKASEQSLILRRGVIDGCRFVKETIAAMDPSELGARLIFYKTIPATVNYDSEALRREAMDYITRLERFFLSYQSNNERDLNRIFITELSSKWEESKWFYVRGRVAPQFGSWLEEQFHKTAHFQMKMLRNWSSHRLLSRELSARETAYFFMLAMRVLVQSDLSEIARYEKGLSTLFINLSDLELNRLMNSALAFHLERSYEQLKVLHKDVLRLAKEFSGGRKAPNNLNRRIDNYFLWLFRELGEVLNWLEQVEQVEPAVLAFHRQRIKEVSLRLFYQSFWHGLFPMEIQTTFYADLQRIKFYIEPFQHSFINFIGQAIFEECFKETESPEMLRSIDKSKAS